MNQKNFSQLSSEYSDKGEEVNIAVGLRPSGVIHLANMATMSLAGIVGRDIGAHLSRVNLTVCDLDLPDAKDWSLREHGYVKYFGSLPDKDSNYGSLLEKSLSGINEFSKGLSRHLEIPYVIRKLSDIQKDPGFREGLKRVLETEGIMQYILRKIPKGNVLVFPLCDKCETSSPSSEYKDGNLITECTNPDCVVGRYEVDVLDTDRSLAVHFFIDPLRDKTVKPYADIHIFGGDYRDSHDVGPRPNDESFGLWGNNGVTKISKIEKIAKIIDIASEGKKPDILIGPTFFASDGTKMSKRKNNGLSLKHLTTYFGDDSPKRISDFMAYIIKEGITVLDYRVVEEKLLSKRHL